MAGYLESDIFIGDFKSGNKEAIEAVYFQYYKDIFYFCRKMLDNREDAQDITLDTLNTLFNKKEDFESLPNIKAFLYITARNRCLDVLRRRKTIALHQKSLQQAILSSYDSTNDELDLIRLKEIDDCIKKLPPRPRQVIELLFLRQEKYKDAAKKMNMSVRAVVENRQKGLVLLREMLQQLHPAELVWVLMVLFIR